MNRIALGKITEVLDDNTYPKTKFVIKVDIAGEVEDAIAFPLDTLDQPELGEEVLIFRVETIFGFSYLWKKLKLNDDTRLKVLGSVIDITKDGITISSDPEEDKEDPSSTIYIAKDGSVTISTSDKIDIITTNNLNLVSNDKFSLDSKNNIDIKTDKLKITGTNQGFVSTVTVDGMCTPDPTLNGAFCGIPTCPFTGAPHVGNIIKLK